MAWGSAYSLNLDSPGSLVISEFETKNLRTLQVDHPTLAER